MADESKSKKSEKKLKSKSKDKSKKSLKKRNKLIDNLKRPQTAYFLFCSKTREEYKKRGDDKKLTAKELGEMWRNLPDSQKKPFKDKFEEAESRYSKYYDVFNNFLTNANLKEALRERGIGVGNRFDKQAKKFICAYMAMSNESKESLAEAADHLITSRLFRSLKNRYDLTADNLREFKEFYGKLFSNAFSHEPSDGLRLLDNEIENKK